MRKDDEEGSAAEVASTHAPTTIPEEPTPVSPASPAIPIDSSEAPEPAPAPAPEALASSEAPPQSKPPAGRFIENISPDGSRASAEDDANDSTKPTAAAATGVPETEMKQARLTKQGSNVFRRASKKKTAQTAKVDAAASSSQPQRPATGNSSSGNDRHISPSTESSTQKASPHPNDLSSPSDEGGRHYRSFKQIKGEKSDRDNDNNDADENEDDEDEEEHPWLAALYPLTNFIGYRPLSHPHTPRERRRTPKDPHFNRFHYICGRIFSFGLPVSGDSGEVARYRDPDTGKIELVRMYRDQVGAKVINSIHSVIAAWVVIALLTLVSRSPFHRAHDAPLIIGAFATEAVVSFFAFRTPLAQPKNILFGNTISAVIGVAMEKAFADTEYSVDAIYGIDWAVAATAVSAAVFSMQIFGFTHPPGAAIALLAITDRKTHELDWWLVPIVVIGSLIVIGWALVINNVGGRRYPENWFYANAFAEPPVIGPEKLPFSNSPVHPLRRRKRKGAGEKGFYRVPDSGAKVTNGFGVKKGEEEEKGEEKVAPMAEVAKGSVGAARVRRMEQEQHGRGASGSGEDGRTTRASEVTRVESIDSAAVLQPGQGGAGMATATAATQQQQQQQSKPDAPASAVPLTAAPAAPAAGVSTAPAASTAPTAGPSAPAAPASTAAGKSRMIETDPTMVSRNNSKSSKRSRRSIVVHENRRLSDTSNSKAPPVPAVQWRNSQS